jgi:hypothetical protein
MIRVIAITQFVFLALGAFTINVIVRSGVQDVPPLSGFLARYGGWFLVLPVLWMALASICESVNRGVLTQRTAQATGVFLAAAILGVYIYAIYWQL